MLCDVTSPLIVFEVLYHRQTEKVLSMVINLLSCYEH